ncbi:unnamed protein product [Onchocerca ochengi]|uniref:Cytotoxic translational repressor of toxin-antitoxin stability system n=1 Tax=Onchocerca ochengi TaxID=42157 RepID=A0A182EPR2_ONCOC|nr:unnamed protein product [Onchocerca ochengi]
MATIKLRFINTRMIQLRENKDAAEELKDAIILSLRRSSLQSKGTIRPVLIDLSMRKKHFYLAFSDG